MIQEAQALFDELVVAIGINPEKCNTYTIDERRDMLEAITEGFPNVRISVFENRFLVRYAREIGAGFIVRGIRSAADYEYERSMRYINSDLAPEISTFPDATARNRRSVFHYGQRPGRPRWLARHNTPLPARSRVRKNRAGL